MKTIKIYNIFPVDRDGYTSSVSGQFPCDFELTQEALDSLDTKFAYEVGAHWEVQIRDYDPEFSITTVYGDNEIEDGLLGFNFDNEPNRYIYKDISEVKSSLN